MRSALLTILTAGALLQCLDSATVPPNPCPDVFQYFQDNNGLVYGRVMFQNDYSGYYELSVNMSVAAYLNREQNIQLELQSSANDILAARPLVYNVYFPIQDVIPRPTRIGFNERVYCSGPPEQLRPGRGITNMWAATYYRISLPSRRPAPEYITQRPIFVPPTRNPATFPQRPWQEPSTAPTTRTPLPTIPWLQISTSTTTPITTPSTQPPTPAPTPSTTVDYSLSGEECGLSTLKTQELVVNGEDIVDGQYPWLVAILYRQNFDYKYRCTGSLVSNRHIITAGHCMRYNKALLSVVEDLLLVFGSRNVQGWANGALLRDVQNITVHPDYKQNNGDGDIAILTVQKPIVFESDVKPVCLWQGEETLDKVVGMQGAVVGWGRDGKGKDITSDAKKVDLPIVSQVECLRSDPGFSSITSSRTFCAGNRNGAGPCHGDSGAGFAMQKNGRWVLRGVVSTALGDLGNCDLTNYFVFVDIAKIMSWVRQVMA